MKQYKTLDEVWQSLWDDLLIASKNPKSAIRFLSLATQSAISPEQRMVVLRRADKEKYQLSIHTDKRSQKYQEIFLNSSVSLLFWNPRKSLQFRLNALTVFEKDQKALKDEWSRLSNDAKSLYGLKTGPGQVISQKQEFIPTENKACDSDKAFENFSVLHFKIHSIDWLNLSREGHQRAFFKKKNQSWESHWVSP